MHEVQQEILLVLLQMLLDRKLITQEIHDKSRSRILAAENLPVFFCCGEENTDGDA